MNLNILILYNPPSHNISFYDKLTNVCKNLRNLENPYGMVIITLTVGNKLLT